MPAKKIEAKKPVKKVAVKKTAKPKSSVNTLSVSVMDLAGKKVGSVLLPSEIFGSKINSQLMAQAVRVYLANQRQGAAHSKTRGEVQGSTRKVWRQKGTGRARHGSVRGPIFVGGGITFGPVTRDFSLEMPKKMKKSALVSALSSKMKEDKVIVLDETGLKDKTKQLYSALKSLKLLNKRKKIDNTLLVTANSEKKVYNLGKNIEGLTINTIGNINTYEVLSSKSIVLLKSCLEDLKKGKVSNS